ncbi:alpha/beta fold hydrolase [Pseudonocardia sp. Ae717_Ps2]|uniref:alpha/beta fold hydrolase n=1 Tax=Pseudonocardia sp. Ae717_Ps2 TaxID=1885573 RepID=UPI001300E6F2|nr:alpha/beta fold hydrolase [Pseudonocardia sp. Ae717_Ps2]
MSEPPERRDPASSTDSERPAATDRSVPGERRVPVESRDVAVRLTGADRPGPPVVFLSGLTGSHSEWEGVVPLLPDSPLLTYGRPGLGGSDPLPHEERQRDDPSDVAEHLHQVLRATGLPGPYVVVSHSIAGWFADRYVARHLEDVAAVVLIDPTNFTSWPDERTGLADGGPGGFQLEWQASFADLECPPRRPPGGAVVISTAVGAWVRKPPKSPWYAPLTLGQADARWQHDQRAWAARLHADHVIAHAPEHLIQRAQPLLVAVCVTAAVRAVRAGVAVALDPSMVSTAGGTLVSTGSAAAR